MLSLAVLFIISLIAAWLVIMKWVSALFDYPLQLEQIVDLDGFDHKGNLVQKIGLAISVSGGPRECSWTSQEMES